jgi:hypothetical protein
MIAESLERAGFDERARVGHDGGLGGVGRS